MKFLGIVFILQKDNETDHLRIKESFRTLKTLKNWLLITPNLAVTKILQ
jgi:hypothetical protein